MAHEVPQASSAVHSVEVDAASAMGNYRALGPAGCEHLWRARGGCYASSAMERSSGELFPPDKRRRHSPDRIAVGAFSRAGHWLTVASGSDRSGTPTVVDAALGAGTMAVYATDSVVQVGWRLSAPLRRIVARPPLVPERYQPATFVDAFVQRGEQYRLVAELAADAVVSALVKQVVDGVLDQIDLTTLVLERVDLDRVVEAVDIDAIIHRLDLAPLATYVIDEIDLPEIIRQSTGFVATEAVRGVRMQSVGADQAVQRTVDRMLRRKARPTGAAVPPTNGTEQ